MMSALSVALTSTLFAKQPPRLNWDNLPSLILGVVALGIFVAIAWYVLSKIRQGQKSEEVTPSEALSNFSALYESGEISYEEYQAIKQRLAASLASSFTPKKSPESDGRSGRKKRTSGIADREAELERLLAAERKE